MKFLHKQQLAEMEYVHKLQLINLQETQKLEVRNHHDKLRIQLTHWLQSSKQEILLAEEMAALEVEMFESKVRLDIVFIAIILLIGSGESSCSESAD